MSCKASIHLNFLRSEFLNPRFNVSVWHKNIVSRQNKLSQLPFIWNNKEWLKSTEMEFITDALQSLCRSESIAALTQDVFVLSDLQVESFLRVSSFEEKCNKWNKIEQNLWFSDRNHRSPAAKMLFIVNVASQHWVLIKRTVQTITQIVDWSLYDSAYSTFKKNSLSKLHQLIHVVDATTSSDKIKVHIIPCPQQIDTSSCGRRVGFIAVAEALNIHVNEICRSLQRTEILHSFGYRMTMLHLTKKWNNFFWIC